MRPPQAGSSLRFIVALAAAAATLTCSSVEPSGGLAVNHVVAGQLSATDTVVSYPFGASPNVVYIVLAQVTQGSLALEMLDPGQGRIVQTAVANVMPGPSTIEDHPVMTFSSPTGGSFVLKASSNPAGGSVTYSVLLRVLNPNPEVRPATFTLGDTVSGETIDPPTDQDIFTTTGVAGQQFSVTVEASGTSDMADLTMILQDSTAFGWYAIASAVATPDGTPAQTVRVVLQNSGKYRLVFASAYESPRRFRGAYRFWTSFIDLAPEHRPAVAPLDTVVGDEPVDFVGDVDTFAFQLAAPTTINAFVQSGRAVRLDVVNASGTTLGSVTSAVSDTALFDQYSGRITLPAGRYTARVNDMGPASLAAPAPYRFYLYAIDPAPEHVPATLTPGDSVTGERLDLPGDEDDFLFSATAGEEYNVFLQSTSGAPTTHIQLTGFGPDAAVITALASSGTDTALLYNATGRFRVNVSGTQRLRVREADFEPLAAAVGPYRLMLTRVNHRPESSPDTIALNDSVMSEAIDVGGDLDDYRVFVPSGTRVAVAVSAAADAPAVSAVLLDSTGTNQVLDCCMGSRPGWMYFYSDVGLSGHYVLRVQGAITGGREPYQLRLYGFQVAPETANDTIAIGDTVSSEAIDVPFDVDVFHFHAVAGQDVEVQLQGQSNGASGAFHATLSGTGMYVTSPLSSAALSDHRSWRWELGSTGWYALTVTGGTDVGYPHGRDAYRLTVLALGSQPEHAPAQLALGDSVTTEQVDVLGDRDDFFVHAPPGSEVAIVLSIPNYVCCSPSFPWVTVMDSVTGDTVVNVPGQGVADQPGVKVPASGVLRLKVWEGEIFGTYPSFTGPYSLAAIPVNRAPEHVSAVYTVGDTVTTEDLTLGDIDEFTATATPGDTLTPGLLLRAAPIPSNGGLMIEIVDPATGTSLLGSGVSAQPRTSWYSPGSFVVPGTGRFIVRVQGGFGNIFTIAPYSFYVKKLH